jgi:hypothetical protein
VKRALGEAEKLGKTRKPVQAGLLLRAVRRTAPDSSDAVQAVEVRLAQKDVLMLGSETHPLVAFVSLPKSWKKGGKFPVLIAVDGAGCNFLGAGRGFSKSRGSRPVIVISPVTLSNTNALNPAKYPAYDKALLDEWGGRRMDFDGPGMEAILTIVRERFGGEEKVFVTGFSGGGNYCYWKFITDPEGCRGAAPACANYSGMGIGGAEGPGEGGGPPIHIMTGAQDPHRTWTFGKEGNPGIEPQTDNAEAKLKELGFTNVRRTMIKGAKHSSLQKQVWEFVDEVLGN